MPAPIITTAEPVLPVRELRADEEYVMMAFERHASHCYHCNDPLGAHLQGDRLCDRGDQYATDVSDYLYSKNRKSYSAVDRDRNQPTLVKIPRDCLATHGLLLALEEGLRLRTKKSVTDKYNTPVISYDRTYNVAPRRSPNATEIIERQPRTVKSRRVIVYHSPHRGSPHRGSPSRGSLYDSDAADQVERVKESSRIYRMSGYYR